MLLSGGVVQAGGSSGEGGSCGWEHLQPPKGPLTGNLMLINGLQTSVKVGERAPSEGGE